MRLSLVLTFGLLWTVAQAEMPSWWQAPEKPQMVCPHGQASDTPKGHGHALLWTRSTPPVRTRAILVTHRTLNSVAISSVINPALPRLTDCYQDAFETDLDHGGWLRLSLRVRSAGRVSRVDVEGASTRDRSLVRCIREALQHLQFPKMARGDDIEVDLELVPPFTLSMAVRASVRIQADIPVSRQVRQGLRNCLAGAIAAGVNGRGTIVFRFRVDQFGQPQGVRVQHSTLASADLEVCTVRRIKELRLEAEDIGVERTVPVEFRTN